ncbi:MAG: hypothetical protein E2O29_02090 [Deltaproteobacteria bacterium]|nr:MAG: hypothetical protein E2O29_02090 [Deltaproteobacteria bacterium]
MAITLSKKESNKVRVTSNDSTPDFLLSKIVAGSTKLTVVETNDGGDEDLTLDVDQTSIDHDLLLNFIPNEHIDHTAVTLIAGDGLVGGGDISVNRTFDVAINPEASVTAAPTDEVLIADASDSFNIKKVTVQSIADLGGGGGSGIFAQLSSSVDQEPTVTTPVVITYNTQDDIAGMTHSTTVNPGEITIDTAGKYFMLPQPQVGKSSGGSSQALNMFLQVDRGSGFVDEPNSNIIVSVSDNTATDVIVLGITIVLDAGDKVRLMQRVTSTSVGLGLKFTALEVGPPTIPATPSIICTMFSIGA